MDVYVFIYKAVPTRGSLEYGKVGGAHAEIWVVDSSKESAEIKAKTRLIDLAWDLIELENELVLNDELILNYPEDTQASYHRAKQEGIYEVFVAHPPEDREDGVVEIRSLDVPKINKTKH
jgi:hypothetical protein